jgi:outer membrane receptor protein involved in Fe transport
MRSGTAALVRRGGAASSAEAIRRSDLAPFMSASHRFVSGANSNFTATLPIANYNIFDIRGGAHLGHNVTATFYVDNIADKRGVTASQTSTTSPTYLSEYYIRPRRFGLQFDWNL